MEEVERAVARPTDTMLKRSHSATTQYTINNSTLTLKKKIIDTTTT